jgi:protein SDA1
MERDAENLAGIRPRKQAIEDDNDEFVDVSKIMAGVKRKDDYEARMESIKSGRENRKFGSKRGSDERTSITNREKAKKTKAFMMVTIFNLDCSQAVSQG